MLFVICLMFWAPPVAASDPPEEVWKRFQNLARHHEDKKYQMGGSEFDTSCAMLGLDDGLEKRRRVDRWTRRDSSSSPSPPAATRVLFLTTVQALFKMTDRWYFHLYLALAKQTSRYDVVLWGVGLPGFHVNETLATNLERWFVDPKFDVVFTTWSYHRTLVDVEPWKNWYYTSAYADVLLRKREKHSRQKKFPLLSAEEEHIISLKRRATEFHRRDTATGVITALLPGAPVVVVMFHEVESKEREDIVEILPHVVLVKVEQQLGVAPGAGRQVDMCGEAYQSSSQDCQLHPVLRSYLSDHPSRVMLAYMPNGIHSQSFFDPAEQQRDWCDVKEKTRNILLMGAINEQVYPLRSAAALAAKGLVIDDFNNNNSKDQGKEPSRPVLELYGHPGYDEDIEHVGSLADMCKYFYRRTLPQQQAYNLHMKQSRMCVIGSRSFNFGYERACSPFSWALRKYTEAMAAGCVVIGDPPTEHSLARHMPYRLTDEAIHIGNKRRQSTAQLRDSLRAALAAFNANPAHFRSHFCLPGRAEVWSNYTYDSLINRFLTPALRAYTLRGARGVFEDTRSPFMVRNQPFCANDKLAVGNKTIHYFGISHK